MSKHTPKPWKYDSSGQTVRAEDDQLGIADIRGFGRLSKRHGVEAACEIMDANGRLIAAAPEMYELLKELRNSVDCNIGKSIGNPMWLKLIDQFDKLEES